MQPLTLPATLNECGHFCSSLQKLKYRFNLQQKVEFYKTRKACQMIKEERQHYRAAAERPEAWSLQNPNCRSCCSSRLWSRHTRLTDWQDLRHARIGSDFLWNALRIYLFIDSLTILYPFTWQIYAFKYTKNVPMETFGVNQWISGAIAVTQLCLFKMF